jgi:hypothetical protein
MVLDLEIRIAQALERLATVAETFAGDIAEKWKLEDEDRNWEKIPLGLMGPQDCPYCKRTKVPLVARGVTIFGCVDCLGAFLRSPLPPPTSR